MYYIFQLDSDGDGQLSFAEFKVLFDNAEKRKQATQKTDVCHCHSKVVKS